MKRNLLKIIGLTCSALMSTLATKDGFADIGPVKDYVARNKSQAIQMEEKAVIQEDLAKLANLDDRAD